MSLKVKEWEEQQGQQAAVPAKPAGMVEVTLVTYHEAEPRVLSVPKGTKVEDILAQAGMAKQESWEVHIDNKLASFTTVVDQGCTLLYGLRLTGGRR